PRQESILLRLVEAMHFIEEQHRPPPGFLARFAGALRGGANVLHASHDGGERDELGVACLRDEARERRLARTGRAPQDHRMQMPAFEHPPQRLAGPQQMCLPDVLVERRRPQTIRERTRIGRRCSDAHCFLVNASMRCAQPPNQMSASVSPQTMPTTLAYTSRRSAWRPSFIAPCNPSITTPMTSSATPIIG